MVALVYPFFTLQTSVVPHPSSSLSFNAGPISKACQGAQHGVALVKGSRIESLGSLVPARGIRDLPLCAFEAVSPAGQETGPRLLSNFAPGSLKFSPMLFFHCGILVSCYFSLPFEPLCKRPGGSGKPGVFPVCRLGIVWCFATQRSKF